MHDFLSESGDETFQVNKKKQHYIYSVSYINVFIWDIYTKWPVIVEGLDIPWIST